MKDERGTGVELIELAYSAYRVILLNVLSEAEYPFRRSHGPYREIGSHCPPNSLFISSAVICFTALSMSYTALSFARLTLS